MRFNISLIDNNGYIKKYFPSITIINLRKRLNLLGKLTLSRYSIFKSKNISCSILLTTKDHMQDLNLNFRKIDKSTDVLSFPSEIFDYKSVISGEIKNMPDEFINNKNFYIGDIGFSLDTLNEKLPNFSDESIDIGSLEDYFYYMFIHSLLHLAGFDHEEDLDAEAMELIEREIFNEWIQLHNDN